MPLRRGGNLFRAALFHADDDPVYNARLCRDLSRRRDRRRLAKRSDERVSGVRAEPRHQAIAAVAPGPTTALAFNADDVQGKLARATVSRCGEALVSSPHKGRVLRLEPAAAVPARISAACALRHDPLQTQRALALPRPI